MPVYDPKNYEILPLLQNEEQGQLEKVANFYDAGGLLIEEYKTFPKALVGSACIGRFFTYASGKLVGIRTEVQTWTSTMETSATPPTAPPSAINISSTTVISGSPVGTLIGVLTTVDGQSPFVYTIILDPSAKFYIDNNLLRTAAVPLLADVSYDVTIRSTDNLGRTFDRLITVTVIGAGAYNNAISTLHDGVDEVINLGQSAKISFNPGTTAFTISMWFKTTSNGVLIAKSTSSNKQFQIGISGGVLRAFMGSSTPTLSGVTVNNGVWNHVAVSNSLNGGSYEHTIYVNGNQAGPVTTSTSKSNNLDVLIAGRRVTGANAGIANALAGNIDEVSIFDIGLNSSQVSEIYNTGTPIDINLHSANAALVAFYRHGDGDIFPVVKDVGINANGLDGTMVNMEAGDFVADAP